MIFLLGFLISLGSFSVAAPAPTKLTLPEALKMGMEYSWTYKQANSKVREFQAAYSKAESELFPTIDAVASEKSRRQAGGFLSDSFSPATNSELYNAGVTLTQPLYRGGAVMSALSAAKSMEQSTGQRLYETKQATAVNIINAYLNADEAWTKVTIARGNADILKSYFNITSKYAAIGRSKNIDRLQAQASYDLGQSEVLAAESEYEKQLGELQRLLGRDLDASVQLTTKISLQAVETGTLKQLLEKALKSNPSMKALEYDVQWNKDLADVRMSEHKPKLNLEADWGYQSPDRPTWFKEYSNYYSVGLVLKIPLFSGLDSFADRKINAETISRSEMELSLFRDRLRQSLEISLANIKRDFNRLKLAQSASDSARRAMDLAMRDYRQGLLSSTDVLNVQAKRFDAEKQFSTAQYSYHRQVLFLRQDLGVDLEKTYEKIESQ